MIEEIKQLISDNSEEKHFVEYGKGVFATEDAVDEIAEEIVKLFAIHNVSQQRELFVKEQGKWLMANTNLSVEQIIDFEMEFINKQWLMPWVCGARDYGI